VKSRQEAPPVELWTGYHNPRGRSAITGLGSARGLQMRAESRRGRPQGASGRQGQPSCGVVGSRAVGTRSRRAPASARPCAAAGTGTRLAVAFPRAHKDPDRPFRAAGTVRQNARLGREMGLEGHRKDRRGRSQDACPVEGPQVHRRLLAGPLTNQLAQAPLARQKSSALVRETAADQCTQRIREWMPSLTAGIDVRSTLHQYCQQRT
jgi:hypothetical protein